MTLYRITREQYAHDLSGIGAEKYGGRWNTPGQRVVYTSASASMALVEILAWTPMDLLLKSGFVLLVLQCPDESMEEVTIADLPHGWNFLSGYAETQKIGDQWLKGRRTLLMRVPSAILPIEKNLLVNPMHPMMSQVEIQEIFDLLIDPRVLHNL
jgi:RES domain-containing protein